MANKAAPSGKQAKKPSRSIKEKRAAKAEKTAGQTAARKAWEK